MPSYDTGTIGGVIAMRDWLNTFGKYNVSVPGGRYLPTNDKSLVVRHICYFRTPYHRTDSRNHKVSILSAGTFFGALFAFPMADRVGRKWGIIASCGIFALGVGLQLDAHWVTFVVGRCASKRAPSI